MNQPALRPLTIGEVLDGTFSLYRANFGSFFIAAVIPFVPLIVLWLAFGMLIPASSDPDAALQTAALIVTPYSFLATIFAWGALTHLGAAAYRGERIEWREGYSRAKRRLFPLIGAVAVAGVLFALGLLLLIIPGVIALIMAFAVAPVSVLEERGPVEAFRRSRFLAQGAWGRILAVLVLLSIIVALPALAITTLATIVIALSSSADLAIAQGTVQALSQLVSALTTPFVAIGILLQYYDRRVRAEGLDLELETEQLVASV